MKRIFIGIDISEEARSAVAAYTEDLRRGFPTVRVGWEGLEKLHLTLKFLGEVDEREVLAIAGAAERAASVVRPYSAALESTGSFPPKGDPRILWIGLVDDGSTAELATSIGKQCESLGFEMEKRKFSPHLTIGRLREPRSSRDLTRVHTRRQFGPVTFEISQITVFESKLAPTGSTYHRFGSYPLGCVDI